MLNEVSALGLDIGRRRIGIAGCDRTGLIAFGLRTLERRSFQQIITILQGIVAERQIRVLVVGLPYAMNGSMGTQARQVMEFANRLSKTLNVPVEFVDERLTSYEAEQMILAEGHSPSRNKAVIDRKAAALILQRWLDLRS